jgi:hypothetical protein
VGTFPKCRAGLDYHLILGLLFENALILRLYPILYSKFGKFGPFFPRKILCGGRNHIFQVEIWRKFASKRNTGRVQLCISGMWPIQ